MSFLDDTYCQLCERFITKEQWNKHLYSSRHLHKKAYGYTPAYFPQRKLTGDESIKLEKAFWKVFFATRDIKEVEDFWWTYFIMTTNMKDYFLKKMKTRLEKFLEIPWRVNLNMICIINLSLTNLNLVEKMILYNKESNGG